MGKTRRTKGAGMFLRRFRHKSTPGTRPGTLIPPKDALAPSIHVTCYGPEKLIDVEDGDLKQVPDLLKEYAVIWIDVVGIADTRVIEQLGEVFGLHRLALADVVNIPQRSKIEHYQEHVFAVTQLPMSNHDHDIQQISFFVSRKFVISIRERPSNCFDTVRERLKTVGRSIRQAGTDYLSYSLLDAVIDAYFPALENIGETLDALDEEMTLGGAPDIIKRIHAVRQDVRLLRRIVWPLRDAVDVLIKHHSWLIEDETSIYLRDCHDHTVQIIDMLENYREACTDLRDLYSTEIGNRMNEIMKVLTVIATIFIPLSFVAGVYGMNFDPEVSPLNMPELKWYWGYPMVLSVMALITLGQLLFFRWKGWLGGGRSIGGKKRQK